MDLQYVAFKQRVPQRASTLTQTECVLRMSKSDAPMLGPAILMYSLPNQTPVACLPMQWAHVVAIALPIRIRMVFAMSKMRASEVSIRVEFATDPAPFMHVAVPELLQVCAIARATC